MFVVIVIVVKTGFNVRDMFHQYYFSLSVNHNTLHFFAWTFYHFTCLPILEGDVIRIPDYEYDKYLSISTYGGNQLDRVMGEKKYQKKKGKKCLSVIFNLHVCLL